jgi:SAM-dependent methyltransferase
MTALVLRTHSQIAEARASLVSRGLAWRTNYLAKLLRRMRSLTRQQIGDAVKSWDVLQTADFSVKHVPMNEPILDIGAFASEIPIVLHRLGFTNLSGVDLNPAVRNMPYADKIQYRVSDFLKTPFASDSFSLITAISVIEHGYRPRALFEEVGRLLRPGGYFVASFDYWPEKISTEGIRMFGMDWRIFSKSEVEELIRAARTYGLSPHGAINLDADQRPITFFDRSYTFAWLALQKTG